MKARARKRLRVRIDRRIYTRARRGLDFHGRWTAAAVAALDPRPSLFSRLAELPHDVRAYVCDEAGRLARSTVAAFPRC